MNQIDVLTNPLKEGGATMGRYKELVCLVDEIYEGLSGSRQSEFDTNIRTLVKSNLKTLLDAAIAACQECGAKGNWLDCYQKTMAVACFIPQLAAAIAAFYGAPDCKTAHNRLWTALQKFDRTLKREADDVINRVPDYQMQKAKGKDGIEGWLPWLAIGGGAVVLIVISMIFFGKRKKRGRR